MTAQALARAWVALRHRDATVVIKGFASRRGIQTLIVRAAAGMDPAMRAVPSGLWGRTNMDWTGTVTVLVANRGYAGSRNTRGTLNSTFSTAVSTNSSVTS